MRHVDRVRLHPDNGLLAVSPHSHPVQARLGTIARAIVCMLVAGLVLALLCVPALAQVRVAPASATYRIAIERAAARNFGLNGSDYVARLAAQLQQESGFRADAQSPFAQGLAQFTPATARWLPSVCPDVGAPDPWDPQWSLRAQACYVAWLESRVAAYRYAGALGACSRWAFALRAYNGGEAMLSRERLAAQRGGANANDWRAVEPYRVRAAWAHKENIGYPRRILLALEPAYLAAGWSGTAVCA